MAYLSDDGTLDTVIVCDICGREHRFSYDGTFDDADTVEETAENAAAAYDAFIVECIEDVNVSCDCGEDY